MQNSALADYLYHVDNEIDVTGKHVQSIIFTLLHEELSRLDEYRIPPKELVITRRVTKTIEQFTVSTTTHSALLRANALGHDILLGDVSQICCGQVR